MQIVAQNGAAVCHALQENNALMENAFQLLQLALMNVQQGQSNALEMDIKHAEIMMLTAAQNGAV